MISERRQYSAIRAGLFGTAVLGILATVSMAWRFSPVLTALRGSTACGCGAITTTMNPWLTGLAIFLIVVAGALVVIQAASLLRHIRRHRQATKALEIKFVGRAMHRPTGEDLTIIRDMVPRAVTVGIIQPRIIVTTGLLHRLTKSEVAAVIRHEQQHRRAYDPLWTVCIAAIASTWGWLPWVRTWAGAAYSLRELCADAAATDGYRSINSLSGAILKFSEPALTTVVGFSPNADRVEKLLDQTWRPSIRYWRLGYTAIFIGVAIVVGLVLKTGNTVQAAELKTTRMCHEVRLMCAASRPVTTQRETVCFGGAWTCASIERQSTITHVPISPR